MKFAFCPYCGHKLDEDFAFCPKCGKRLNNDGGAETSANTTEQTDDLFGGALGGASSRNDFSALGNMLDGEIERKTESDKKHRLIRVLCVREMFDEATELCNELIETDPEDLAAYIGFIRIESKDYSIFEEESIDKAIKVAKKIYGINNDLAKADNELAAYFTNRENYITEKQKAEKERKAKEAAAIKAEEERKLKEEAEREAQEQAKIRKKFEINGTTLVKYKKANYNGNVVIPDGITIIGKEAFKDCDLTSVEMPNSVTSIGVSAFNYCSSLTSIEIPDSVTSIGNFAFEGCSSLTSIEIPNSVTSIGINAFYGCESLKKITFEGSSDEWYDIDGYDNVDGSVYCKGDGQWANMIPLTD